jgi:probable selenium-dependent hydroxylase accessory protein YqeC
MREGMELNTLLSLKEGSIVSVVGAGGKTTFIFSLAQELRLRYKVLVTTTTKIYVPQRNQYDFIVVEDDEGLIEKYCHSERNGIYVFGTLINEEQKLRGLNDTKLMNIYKYFDYVLIEADGSKRKPVKGWNDTEPIISSNTTATIGILDIQVLGKEINEDLVHRIDKFMELTGAHRNQLIGISHLEALIFSEKGLFKNAAGEKTLFINKVESEENFMSAAKLVQKIYGINKGKINRIITGSLKNNNFKLEN